MDSARALIARGWGVSLVSRCLRVSRAQLHVILRRTDDWMDGRRSRHTDDTDVLLRVQDVMLGAVERRFGNELPASPVEWLTDNGSCYRANETRQFARMLGLEPKNTAVRSPESNGIAESFVKTIKRDYISIIPKPDGLTAAKNLAEAFEHYNEWHPHSALGYRSPREYLRQQASNGLSDNRCLEI